MPTFVPSTGENPTDQDDLVWQEEASRAISGEIVMDRLLRRIVDTLMAQVDADRVAVLMMRARRLYLEAEGRAKTDVTNLSEPVPIEKVTGLPARIVRYVAQEREAVFLKNTFTDTLFSKDAYFREARIGSVFCTPVCHREDLIAVLYSEKSSSAIGFSPLDCDRMERLALQAAAALKNALLYRELKQANLDTQQLTRQLIKIQENERHKVSRDLTDNVAQVISSAKVISETLFDNQSKVAPGIRSKAAELTHRLQTSIRAIRRLSEELRPPGLDQLGLVSSVYSLCREFHSRQGLKVDFYSAGLDEMGLDFEIEINLYRIVQEALENVVKHARTSEATVRLLASFPNIILRIEDNGCGFEIATDLPVSLGANGLGLKGMQERAKLLRGKLKIQSRRGEGTRILVVVPYSQEISACF